MTLEEFRKVMLERIPTPEEFVTFVRCQNWQIAVRGDGQAVLRGPGGDPILVALARMLAREPYRTNVLAIVCPRATVPTVGIMREWLWRDGHRYVESDEQAEHPTGAWWYRHQGEPGWRVVEEKADKAEIGREALFAGVALPAGERLLDT